MKKIEEDELANEILESEDELIIQESQGGIAIAEWRPFQFVKSKASAKDVLKLLRRRSASYWDDSKDFDIDEPKVRIARISRDQKIKLEFN